MLSDLKILGGVVLVVTVLLLISAIWLATVLLREADTIKNAALNVQTAFDSVNVEINRKLKHNKVIAYADLLGIVSRVAMLLPGVAIRLEKDFELKRFSIIIEKDGIKATYTMLATIVEYSYKPSKLAQE